jgi:heme/copper-type cytochrome/quinol oxidase subunit 2
MKKSIVKVIISCLIVLSVISYFFIGYTESSLNETYQQQKIEINESSEKIVTNAKLFTVLADRFIKVISSNY